VKTIKRGRDSITGRFVPIEETCRRPETTTVDTLRIKRKPKNHLLTTTNNEERNV